MPNPTPTPTPTTTTREERRKLRDGFATAIAAGILPRIPDGAAVGDAQKALATQIYAMADLLVAERKRRIADEDEACGDAPPVVTPV
jgi:hypothetical protein